MAKQGMKRPDETSEKKRQNEPTVPELQHKQKNSKEKANPIVAGSERQSDMKVYHHKPTSAPKKEKPISDA